MTQSSSTTSQPEQVSLAKRMLVGAAIGLLLISVFLLSATEPNPSWGKLWMLRPLVVVPSAGAMGGFCNYFLIQFRKEIGVSKTAAVVLGAVVFVVGLWLGIVLGLDGTYWD